MAVSGRVRFADFAFDPVTGELWKGDAAVPLENQPARALRHLIASAGRVVTREELAAAVWGRDTHVKFDDGLNYCIRQIRAALGDDAKAPRFVETLPRRGYRFVALAAPDHGNTEAPKHGNVFSLHTIARHRISVAAIVAATIVAVAIVESRPNNHHQVAVSMVKGLHDLIF